MNLYKYVSDEINKKLGFEAKLDTPKNRDFGDFATNAAMVGAKTAGKNPRELANEYLPLLKELDFVADVSVAGPGFINIKIKDDFILQNASAPKQMSSKKPLNIDLDYAGYNIGKALHIGHLRTIIVGDTFNRIAKFLGHKTKSYNHIGDWGRPMGLVIAWILEYGKPKNADKLNTYYPLSTARAKEDPEWMERVHKITSELQAGNPEYRAIYDDFMKISLKQMDDVLIRLNAMPFDMTMGERGVSEYVPAVQKILESKNLLKKDEGALIVDVKQESDNAPMPPLMFRTSADTQTYAAADLTAIYYRTKTDNPDAIIYFTDTRQKLHFNQVFRAAKMANITKTDLIHIGFGALTGNDGKPFKTRDGGVANLTDILDTVENAVQTRVSESGKQLDTDTIKSIALAAVKFNDLIHDVKSDYVFDPNAITNFEGKTGPYILYTAVRLNSVLKRANTEPQKQSGHVLTSEERNLLIEIMDFEHMILSAYENRATDMIANYTYDLCQLTNNFYHNCPVLRDDIDEQTKAGRLYIAKLAFDTLSTAIDLMGLKIPREM